MAKRRSADTSDESVVADDAQQFRAAVRDVKPLRHAMSAAGLRKPRVQGRRGLEPAARAAAADELTETMPLIATRSSGEAQEGSAVEDSIAGADALSFRRPGVRDRELRRLRRGLYPIENELDLHGLSQAAARGHLADFIEANRHAGHRCVRIIHGKGYRSGARGPILKIAVNTWLRRHHDVMAFTSARTIDGGTGAVYVLLRA